ncbi:MAG: dihydropteroate synthase [Paracoccaceae bacterium]
MEYFRPILQSDAARPEGAVLLAGGWCWFDRVEVLSRSGPPRVVAVADVPKAALTRLTARRTPMAGLEFDGPRLMGILNVTPDSFSDGGRFVTPEAALAQAQAMAGADILDIGGESTRPGAVLVDVADEVQRTAPVIAAIRAAGITTPISIDTRKARVARAAMAEGADIVNDVSGLTFDTDMAGAVAEANVPVILMHAQGTPQNMQAEPRYDDVLLDVYDWLAERVAVAEAAGIARHRIAIDPGIGFGKTVAHNLALLQRLSLFHALGCPVMLGASRKRFIGTIGQAGDAQARMPGSVAVALAGIAQGVQMLRVHDVGETRQAMRLWHAVTMGDQS